jgi:transcriptional regulator with PAS, ATPase and Fis domain
MSTSSPAPAKERVEASATVAPQPFLGVSPGIRRLKQDVESLATKTRGPILLLGATGSGKGVLAKWLHHNGVRAKHPFVELNSAALKPELLESELFGYQKGAFTGAVGNKPGLLEIAHRGTIFLDEIGDMDLQIQARLLKVIEERTFRRLGDVRDIAIDVQLMAATNHDLQRLVSEKRFRQDLYFRINAVPITIPSLRERKEDIPYLVKDIVDRLCREFGLQPVALEPDVLERLTNYDWPGNIRELHNVLERAVLVARGSIQPEHLFLSRLPISYDENVTQSLEEVEKRHIAAVLQHHQGNVDRAAVVLGISRSSLYTRVKRYGLATAVRGPLRLTANGQ